MSDAKRAADGLREYLEASDSGDVFVGPRTIADAIDALDAQAERDRETNMLIEGLHDAQVALEEARRERDEAREVALEERDQKHWSYTSAKNTAIMDGWKKA